MNTTKILGEAVGVQWQGVTDQTETSTVTGLTQAIVIGRFKRGEVGKAMIIHQGNIRSMLGHEPTNPYYIAVQAVLDAGVPSVQVLRVGTGGLINGECYYTVTSIEPIHIDKNGLSHFPWFRINTENVDRWGNQVVDDYYFTQLVSLIPTTGVNNHYPQYDDHFSGNVIGKINAILQPHGITASETPDHFVKLTSPNPFYVGAIDADGAPIGVVFDVFGEAPNSCEIPLLGSDYAYLSVPLNNIRVDIFDNGDWVRINEADDPDNDDQSVISRLLSHGIGVFKTFDGLGCFDLYRFQSMNNSQKKIAISLVDNLWAGNGIMVLTPQANGTINKFSPADEEGYNRIELTLLPDNSFVPEQYLNSFSPRHNLRFFKTNSETSESYKYKFEVDNVPVHNPNGGTEFILSDTASLDNVIFALNQVGIRSNWYFDGNEVQTEFECLVTGAYKTLKVRQMASAIAEYEYIDYGMIISGINMVDKSPTNYQLEFSLYDPIDLAMEI